MKSFETYIKDLAAKDTTLRVETVDWYCGRQACLIVIDSDEAFCALTPENDCGYDDDALAAIAKEYATSSDTDCERVLRKAYAKEEEA